MRPLLPPAVLGLADNRADILQAVPVPDGDGLEVHIGGNQLGGAVAPVEAAEKRRAVEKKEGISLAGRVRSLRQSRTAPAE